MLIPRRCILLATLMSSLASGVRGAEMRQGYNFNREWRFVLSDPRGAESVGFDDSNWQRVGLPHSFSEPYFMSPDFYVGYGWYRKHFDVPAAWSGKRVSLEFEAAFQDAEIFANGRKVGEHRGGYTGFPVDLTAALHAGDNVVAVRLNNLWKAQLAPRAGEHTFSGGIYRNVHLVVTNPLHVDWCGTFVTTPQASADVATVNVKTDVVNGSDTPETATVRQTVLDADGKQVAQVESAQGISAGATTTFDQRLPPIAGPKLWSSAHPYLYSVQTTILRGDQAVDDYSTIFGIRSMRWTADQGFFLNGEHLYLLGANVHQDHAGWGDAVTSVGSDRDVRMVKEAGFNFIRGSHYPHSPAFADACDRVGVLLWSENNFWGIGGFRPDGYWNCSAYPPDSADQPGFEASTRQELAEMIRIYRNHPAILAWSMCNEPFFSDKANLPKVKELLGQLLADSHRLDPTRAAAIGGCQRPLDEGRLDKVGDVAGYNGDGASVPQFHAAGVPSVVSEYGSTTADRPGKYTPGWGDLSKDHGEPIYPWRAGQAIWCMFDHGSIAGTPLGKMGIVDYFRVPKRAFYWYRNAYAHVPPPVWPVPGTPAGLKLDADHSADVACDGTDDVKLTVTVVDAAGKPISNSPPVQLAVVSGPGEFPTGPAIKFASDSDIRIADGQAAIEFRSYYTGTTVIRATSPGLASADLSIRFAGSIAYAAGTTQTAMSRPYVRFSKKGQPNIQQQFGRDDPTFSSSEAAGHPAGLAADGNGKTFWQPAADDQNPSWTVDLEKSVAITSVKATFPDKSVHRFKVDVSDDRSDWRPVADLFKNDAVENSRQISGGRGTHGRFVRIAFATPATAAETRLAEVEVTGTIAN